MLSRVPNLLSYAAKKLHSRVAVVSRAAICTLCNADVHFAAVLGLQFAEPGLVEFRRGRGIVPQTEQNACPDLGPTRWIICYESGSTSLVDREQGSGPVVRRKKHRWRCSGENVAGSATCENEDCLGNDRKEPRQSRCLAFRLPPKL